MNVVMEIIGNAIVAAIVAGLLFVTFLEGDDAVIKQIGEVNRSKAMLLSKENPLPIQGELQGRKQLVICFTEKTYLTGRTYNLLEELQLRDEKDKSINARIIRIESDSKLEVLVKPEIKFEEAGIYNVTVESDKKCTTIRIPVSGCAA